MLQIWNKTESSEQSGFRIKNEDKSRIYNIMPIIVTWFAGVSGLLWLSELTDVAINPLFSIAVILLLPLICVRWQWQTLSLVMAALAVGTFLGGNDGLLYLVNKIILRYNQISASEIMYFGTGDDVTVSLYIFEILFMAFFVTYMYILIQGKHWVHMLIVSVFMDISLVYLLRQNSLVYLVFGTVSLLGCFIYCQKINEDTRILSGGLAVLSVLFIIIGLIYVNAAKNVPFGEVYGIKQGIIHLLEEMRYGSLDLPEGNLDIIPDQSDEVRLKVTFDKPAVLYLRGYTASEIKDNKWETIDYEKYSGKREGMFRAYMNNGFHPLSQLDTYYSIAYGQKVDMNDITITNVSASTKYEWIPYGLGFSYVEESARVVKDECIRGNNNENIWSYTISSCDYDSLLSENTDELKRDISEEAKKYRSAEADYRRFVMENYGKTTSRENAEDTDNLESTEGKNRVELDRLYVELREKLAKKGLQNNWNSMNYASEGVKELRKHGYAARYVEGYYVDGSDINNSIVEVRGADAHAWAEVYKDSIGFIPVELTPGFYDELQPEKQPENTIEEEYQIVMPEDTSKEHTKDTNAKDDNWRSIIITALIILILLVALVLIVIFIRYIVINRRIQAALLSDDQFVRLKMVSKCTLKLYERNNMSEKDMPQECIDLWNKFWFSSDNRLEKDEEKVLFEHMNKMKGVVCD